MWKVSWNKNLYDFQTIIKDFKQGKSDVIHQSKGRAHFKECNLPAIGDTAYVSCNKQKIMKCEVISDFIVGSEEKEDVYNKGKIRKHASNNTYLKMQIIETYDDPQVLRGCQRTWSKYSE